MASKKVIIPIIIAAVLVIAGVVTGCVLLAGSSHESSSLVIIDADPGVDDAVAFFLEKQVIGHPDIYVATSGNVTSDLLKQNYIGLLDYLDYDGYYAAGAESRMDGKEPYYDGFFGEDGLGDTSQNLFNIAKEKYNYDVSTVFTQEEIDEILDLYFKLESVSDIASVMNESDSVTYVTLGPLTTLAQLITYFPELKNKIDHVYIMGGGLEKTNAPFESEFNMAADPVAAKIVLSSGLNITLFPLDATIDCILSEDDIQKLKETGNYPEIIDLLEYGFAKSLETKQAEGFQMNDPMTVLYQKYPEMYTIEDTKVIINEHGHMEKSDEGYPIHVVTIIDTSKLMEIMEKAFNS